MSTLNGPLLSRLILSVAHIMAGRERSQLQTGETRTCQVAPYRLPPAQSFGDSLQDSILTDSTTVLGPGWALTAPRSRAVHESYARVVEPWPQSAGAK